MGMLGAFPAPVDILMRFSLLAGFVLAGSLLGCSMDTPRGDATAAGASAIPTDAASCMAKGGELRPLGRLQRVQCVVPYADAGKTCSTRQDCTGHCLAIGEVVAGAPAAGTCQRDISENFGCRQRVDGGVAQGILCVD